MPDIGLPELLIILVVVLLLFGANRLPKLGRSLGEGISGFKKGLREGAPEDETAEQLALPKADKGQQAS